MLWTGVGRMWIRYCSNTGFTGDVTEKVKECGAYSRLWASFVC